MEELARQLHAEWMENNRDYIIACRKDPHQNRCSRDFDRADTWENIPEYWKKNYLREARYAMLTR